MFTWLIKRFITSFERRYGYDASYIHFMLRTDSTGARLFMKAASLGQYDRGVPLAPLCAARFVAVLAEDCGPCTQLGAKLALEHGIAPAVLRAIIAGDIAAMPPEVALTYRFAEASLAHDPVADELREEIRILWGDQGIVTLALAILSGRVYPTVKYALGFGQACQRVMIGDESVTPPERPQLRRVA